MTRARAPWWMFVLAASFLGYFALLLYCDLWRPQAEGIRVAFTAGGMRVQAVEAGSPAAHAGLQAGDLVVSAGGGPVRRRVDWLAVEANVEAGRPVALEILRAGGWRPVSLVLEPASWSYWRSHEGLELMAVRAAQLVTLLFGILIAFKRPADHVARAGGWLLATLGVFCVVLPYRIAAVWRGLPAIAGAVLWIPFASSLAIAALLFTFFALFPLAHRRRPLVWALAWLPMILAAARPLALAWYMVYAPDRVPAVPDGMGALAAVSIAYFAAAAVALVFAYRRIADAVERRRLRVLVVGVVGGSAGGAAFSVSYWLSSPDLRLFASPGYAAGALLLLVVPVSFSYAILRHRLFDIRIIVRQGVRYALARGVLAAAVPGLGGLLVLDLLVHRDQPLEAIVRAR